MARQMIGNTGYFMDRTIGPNVYFSEWREMGGGPSKVRHEVIFDVYVHQDGGNFRIPTNEHPDPDGSGAARSAIDVMENLTNGKQRNKYLARGCRFANKPDDILIPLAKAAEATAATMKMRALRAPGAREALQGREMAAAMGPAMVQAIAAMQQANIVPTVQKQGGK